MGSLKHHQHLLFDGTFLHKPVSIVTLMDGETNIVIAGKYGVEENSNEQLRLFFKPLIDKGLDPISCTTDGNPQVIRTIKAQWPGIMAQRCLVHIQRQGLSWCRRSPKTVYARDLRTLFNLVTDINTEAERDLFLENLSVGKKCMVARSQNCRRRVKSSVTLREPGACF